MMKKENKLSQAESLLVEIAHSDAQLGHQQAERIMQGRLATITASHGVTDGTEVSFLKKDGGIYLVFDDGQKPDLHLESGGDATAYDDFDGN